MPHLIVQQSLFCRVLIVASCLAGPATAQTIEIVTSSGSRILLAPDNADHKTSAIAVPPSGSGRAAPFYVAPRVANPMHLEGTSPLVVAVTPSPTQPLVSDRVSEPITVEAEQHSPSVMPTPLDVGRQIAEALARDEVIRLRVNFDFNSANVRPESLPLIETIADAMRADTSLLIEVQGHTDDVGKLEYNQILSERRAHEVRHILIERYDVAERRITAVGYGMSRPSDPRTTDEARAANRRVEIHYRDK